MKAEPGMLGAVGTAKEMRGARTVFILHNSCAAFASVSTKTVLVIYVLSFM
jgi:hypothetical protein